MEVHCHVLANICKLDLTQLKPLHEGIFYFNLLYQGPQTQNTPHDIGHSSGIKGYEAEATRGESRVSIQMEQETIQDYLFHDDPFLQTLPLGAVDILFHFLLPFIGPPIRCDEGLAAGQREMNEWIELIAQFIHNLLS
jgi:hypothetical protein